MRSRNLKCTLMLFCSLLLVAASASRSQNLFYHGGPTISSAKVVLIFWGPSFNNAASPDFAVARTLQAYRDQFGTTSEYNVITQYSGILLTNLGRGTSDWFDTSTPPTNVTDSVVQSKVQSYLATHGGNNASTVYTLVIPNSSYSSDGSSFTSCGGPNPSYCCYHSSIGSGSSATKYAILPPAGCSGCRVPGFSDVQNLEVHFFRVTRGAVTNPTGTGWLDISGNDADDKCAWSTKSFIGTGGYAYKQGWSNATGSCVRTR